MTMLKATPKLHEAKMGNDHQGLIIDETTGENIAVTYKKEYAPMIVRAVNNFEALLNAAKEALPALKQAGEHYAHGFLTEIKLLEQAINQAKQA